MASNTVRNLYHVFFLYLNTNTAFNKSYYISHCRLAHLFGVAEETFLRQTESVIGILIDNISKFICWPHPSEFEFLANKFNDIGRHFPNVIAAINGLHCEIEIHGEDRTSH